MGLIDKFKQWFGIGGVKIQLDVPAQYDRTGGEAKGKVQVTSKSNQSITKLEVKVVEEWSHGRGAERTTKSIDLGVVSLPGFDIQAGESKTLEFNIPFSYTKSSNENMAEQGGAMGVLGKVAKFADGEKSEFFVKASADVKGTVLAPSDSKPVKMPAEAAAKAA